jgi:hypothetical protein
LNPLFEPHKKTPVPTQTLIEVESSLLLHLKEIPKAIIDSIFPLHNTFA